MNEPKTSYVERTTSCPNEVLVPHGQVDPLSLGHLIVAAAGILLTAIATEYAKLWYFKGIPPWRARALRHANLEAMDKALRERALEFELSKSAIERSLSRMDDLERLCRSQAATIAELQK